MTKVLLERQTLSLDMATLVQRLEATLIKRYGLILNADQLTEVLAFKSKVAFRQAAYKKHLPVAVFSIEHRKGQFALAKDVAIWIASQGNAKTENNGVEATMTT